MSEQIYLSRRNRKLKFVGPNQFQQSFAAYITRHFIERGIK